MKMREERKLEKLAHKKKSLVAAQNVGWQIENVYKHEESQELCLYALQM